MNIFPYDLACNIKFLPSSVAIFGVSSGSCLGRGSFSPNGSKLRSFDFTVAVTSGSVGGAGRSLNMGSEEKGC